MAIRSICGVILAASDPEGLAAFYSKALGIEFEREEHGGLETHYGADIGEVHFGIHPASNLHGREAGRGSDFGG